MPSLRVSGFGKSSLWILLVVVMTASRAKGDFVFAFNTSGTDELVPRTVTVGGTIEIPIYLVQTGAEVRLDTVGMFSMGATVSYAQQSGPAGVATPSFGGLAPHWTDVFFNRIQVDLLGQTALVEGRINDIAFPVKATNNAILLGTLRFDAGAEGNVTSLSLSISSNALGINRFVDNQTFPANDLIFRTTSIQTISSVPEPSSLLMVGLLGGALALTRRSLKFEV